MKWSQLKKRIEANFADSLAGRVQVWVTRYRNSPEHDGEAWFTLDGERFAGLSTAGFFKQINQTDTELRATTDAPSEYSNENADAYWQVRTDAERLTREAGQAPLWDFTNACHSYLSSSIDEALNSDDLFLRALVMLDRRFGKRRLQKFNSSNESPLVKQLFELRCELEGINHNQPSG